MSLTTATSTKRTQVETNLRRRVADGEWMPGVLLPSRKALAKEYGVDLSTIQRAMASLLQDGTLKAEHRRGTFIGNDVSISNGAHRDKPQTLLGPASAPFASERSRHRNSGHADGSFAPTTAVIGFVGDVRTLHPEWHHENMSLVTIVAAIEAAVSAQGGTTRCINTFAGDTPRTPDAVLRDIRSASLDAVIGYFHEEIDQDRFMDNLELNEAISVLISHYAEPRAKRLVYYDSADAGYQAARHLAARDCSRIMYYSPFADQWVLDRAEGVRNGAIAAGVTFLQAIGSHSSFRWERNVPPLDEMMTLLRNGLSFDGLIAANDRIAAFVFKAAVELGYNPGQDFAMIGFDDEPCSRALEISTMRPPLEDLGTEAANMAYAALAGAAPVEARLQSRVVARATTCSVTHVESNRLQIRIEA
ncbi:MAG: GntR family transcriptional regulator [Capsulimonadaceae bacterium]|nr:GntR family transcriptional regulator [Capsulimonadaceae bacterium]